MSKIGLYIGEIFQINDDLEDYPKMKKQDKSLLLTHKKNLYKQIINELKITQIQKKGKKYLGSHFWGGGKS